MISTEHETGKVYAAKELAFSGISDGLSRILSIGFSGSVLLLSVFVFRAIFTFSFR